MTKIISKSWTTVALFVMVVVALAALVYAQSHRTSPGQEPYTPTRLEWLTVRLEASNLKDTDYSTCGYLLSYTSLAPDTIVIFVSYGDRVDRAEMNKAVEHAREIVRLRARHYGWNWVKIKEKYGKLRELKE